MLLHDVRHREAVHDRRKHTHVVCPSPLYLAFPVLDAAPEVAAAYDDAHLDAHVHAALYRLADLADDAEVKSGLLLSRKRLAAYLEQNALVNGFLVHPYHLKHY